MLKFQKTLDWEAAMKGTVKFFSYLVWLTQLGLSVAVPLVGFILLGTWLHNSKGWGGWVVALGILLGLLGAAGGLYNGFKTLHSLMGREEAEKSQSPSWNRHE